MQKKTMTREQWMAATALVGAIRVCNALFCADGDQPALATGECISAVATMVAEECSTFQLEDVLAILELAEKRKSENYSPSMEKQKFHGHARPR